MWKNPIVFSSGNSFHTILSPVRNWPANANFPCYPSRFPRVNFQWQSAVSTHTFYMTLSEHLSRCGANHETDLHSPSFSSWFPRWTPQSHPRGTAAERGTEHMTRTPSSYWIPAPWRGWLDGGKRQQKLFCLNPHQYPRYFECPTFLGISLLNSAEI